MSGPRTSGESWWTAPRWWLFARRLLNAEPIRFANVFWSPFWVSNQPMSSGLVIDTEHPALAHFPTDTHSNWHWWELLSIAEDVEYTEDELFRGNGVLSPARAVVLNDLPPELVPIIRVIDQPLRNNREAVLFEAGVGRGRLLVCTLDVGHRSGAPHRRPPAPLQPPALRRLGAVPPPPWRYAPRCWEFVLSTPLKGYVFRPVSPAGKVGTMAEVCAPGAWRARRRASSQSRWVVVHGRQHGGATVGQRTSFAPSPCHRQRGSSAPGISPRRKRSTGRHRTPSRSRVSSPRYREQRRCFRGSPGGTS